MNVLDSMDPWWMLNMMRPHETEVSPFDTRVGKIEDETLRYAFEMLCTARANMTTIAHNVADPMLLLMGGNKEYDQNAVFGMSSEAFFWAKVIEKFPELSDTNYLIDVRKDWQIVKFKLVEDDSALGAVFQQGPAQAWKIMQMARGVLLREIQAKTYDKLKGMLFKYMMR